MALGTRRPSCLRVLSESPKTSWFLVPLLVVSVSVENSQNFGFYLVQVVAETRGNGENEFHFSRPRPGNVEDSAFPDVFLDHVGEDGSAGSGAVELDAGVVEGREDVGDTGVRGTPSRGQRQGPDGVGALLGGHKPQSRLSGPGSHKVPWLPTNGQGWTGGFCGWGA